MSEKRQPERVGRTAKAAHRPHGDGAPSDGAPSGTTTLPRSWRALAGRALELCWPFLVVPVVLTALFADSSDSFRDLELNFGRNFLIVLCVGVTALLLYDVVRPRLLGEGCQGYRLALFHVGAVAVSAFG